MKARTLRIKTYYVFDANGNCGSVQAKTRRTAEKLIRQRITDGRPLRIKVSPHNCPECGGDNFGVGNGVPVTVGGWHGGQRFTWGQYAGVHLPLCTGKRCEDCGHTVDIDPDFDG
jgi:hypothetical protein